MQNPLTSLEDTVAETRRVIAEQDGPTVLVGHSFSGVLVSETGLDPKITSLVYVAARAPDAREDYAALETRFPTPPATGGVVFDGEVGRLTEEAFLRDFAGDVPAEKVRILYAVQQPFHKGLVAARTTQAAWRLKPSFYAVSTEDRTINPDLQRFMAKRMGAQTVELRSSHLSMISHPGPAPKMRTVYRPKEEFELIPLSSKPAPNAHVQASPRVPAAEPSQVEVL